MAQESFRLKRKFQALTKSANVIIIQRMDTNAKEYYQTIESRWQTEYPSSTKMEQVWEFYRECGYGDPQGTLKSLLNQVVWTKKRVLDLGCDRGLMLHFIAENTAEIRPYGIDINRQAISAAKSLFPNYEFKRFDGVTIPYPDKHFDLVFVSAVAKHIRYEDRENFYREIKRVADFAYLIEIDATKQEAIVQHGWTFYHSHFEREFEKYFEPVTVIHEAGDLLGLYRCGEIA